MLPVLTVLFTFYRLFEHFGPVLLELADASMSIAEAFAMLRLHLDLGTCRQCAELVLKMIENITNNPNQVKYCQINILSEVD